MRSSSNAEASVMCISQPLSSLTGCHIVTMLGVDLSFVAIGWPGWSSADLKISGESMCIADVP